MVHVCKSHGTDYLCHAFGAAPVFGCIEQGIYNFGIVGKVDKSESGFFFAGAFVYQFVYYGGYASGRLAVAESHERACVAVFESRILVGHKGLGLFRHQRGHKAVVAFVQVYAEAYIFFKFLAGRGDDFYFNTHSKIVTNYERNDDDRTNAAGKVSGRAGAPAELSHISMPIIIIRNAIMAMYILLPERLARSMRRL